MVTRGSSSQVQTSYSSRDKHIAPFFRFCSSRVMTTLRSMSLACKIPNQGQSASWQEWHTDWPCSTAWPHLTTTFDLAEDRSNRGGRQSGRCSDAVCYLTPDFCIWPDHFPFLFWFWASIGWNRPSWKMYHTSQGCRRQVVLGWTQKRSLDSNKNLTSIGAWRELTV